MSVRTVFYPMTWEDDVNSFTVNPRYIECNSAPAYNQYDPRTIAPRQALRNPSLFYEQDMDVRASRRSTSSSNSDETRYTVSSSLPRSRAPPQQSLDPRHGVSRRTPDGIEVDDRTQIQAPKSQRYYCEHPDCVDEKNNPRSVGRKADLKRHMQTVHGDPHIDCEYRRCDRRGDHGFRRVDHYREHLRGYHNQKSESAAKRPGS
ncbi:hypothetical protein LTR70_004253 [Exophiala xenobiotica]|nr:hypothetical protein LTR70_004253 [Exophiala xenobiotica]